MTSGWEIGPPQVITGTRFDEGNLGERDELAKYLLRWVTGLGLLTWCTGSNQIVLS